MFKLCIEDDEGGKTVVPVIRDEITIGRKEGNTIRLTERNVSREHARLVRDNGKVYVEDVAARYGIKKNGERIDDRATFGEGDVVLIGDYRLTLQASKEENAGEPVDKKGGAKNARIRKNVSAKGPPPRPSGSGSSQKSNGGSADASPFNPNQTAITNRADLQPPSERRREESPSSSPSVSEGTEIMPAMPAKLVIVSSNFAGQEFALERREMVIGRGNDCDIIIDHRSVSQKHAKIVREQGSNYKIVDLDSRNGVLVGGEEYRAVYLKRGDVIELGHVKFRFVEPGENYVFTPQSDFEDMEPVAVGGGGRNKMIFGGVLFAAVLIAGGIFLATTMMDDGADSSGGDAVAASSDDGTTSASTTSGSTSGGGLDADKLSEAIAAARKDLESGKVEKAIGKLETARDLFEPDEEQRKEIDDLISKARREVAVKKNYDRAREALGQDKFVAAMQHLTEIPSHSIFADLAGEKKLYETARAGAVAAAQQALDDDREKKARELADEVLLHHPEDSDAKAILAELEKREEQRRVVAARASRNRKSSSNRSSSSGSSSNKTSSSKPSPDEAKKLYASAMKKLARGNFNASIKDCKQGLRGGQHRCNVIIGMAYKQQNNKKNACRYFKKYLSTNPSDAAAIQRQVDQLGCP